MRIEPFHIVLGEGNSSPCRGHAGRAIKYPRTRRTRCLVSTHCAPLDGRTTASAVRHQSLHFRYSLRQREERRRHSRRAVNYYCRRGTGLVCQRVVIVLVVGGSEIYSTVRGVPRFGAPRAGTRPTGRPSSCGPRPDDGRRRQLAGNRANTCACGSSTSDRRVLTI